MTQLDDDIKLLRAWGKSPAALTSGEGRRLTEIVISVLETQIKRIERLEEALRFYGNVLSYLPLYVGKKTKPVIVDNGERARAELENKEG